MKWPNPVSVPISKMKILLLIWTCLLSLQLSAQENVLSRIPLKGKALADFIPDGYDTLATASGDLNKDGKQDLVIILRDKKEEAETDQADTLPVQNRILVILHRESDIYSRVALSDKAVLCKYCGGIFGDPFQGLSIEKGVLLLSHYGGSNWRWAYTHKFRWQPKGYHLIGETRISYWNVEFCDKLGEFAGTEYNDVNYLTGQYEQKKISAEGCKLVLQRIGKRKVKPLVGLNQFNIEK